MFFHLLVIPISLPDVSESWLRDRVQHWLDDEWIEQACHVDIAEHAAASYVAARRQGLTDLGEILVQLGTDLESVDFYEAYVGPWDVANYVAEVLATDPQALKLTDQARQLRQEASELETPRSNRLTNSTWTFSCTLNEPRRRFSFDAKLLPIKEGQGHVEYTGPDDLRVSAWKHEDAVLKLTLTFDGSRMDLTAKVQTPLALTDGVISAPTHKRRLFSSTEVKGRFTATQS